MDTLHSDDPSELLAATEGLRARTRNRLRGAGVPLLGFGLLSLAAAPIAGQAYNFGANGRSVASYPAFAYAQLTGLCVSHAPDVACDTHEFDGAILRFLGWGIWFALLPLAWLALARWYRRRGEARGIVPRRTPWLATAAGAGALVTAVLLVLLLADRTPFTLSLLANSYASPWYVIGIGLLVLGLTERSPLVAGAGLAHTALLTAYLAASWDSGWLPWLHRNDDGWTDGPQPKALLLATILLAAGLAQWTAARRSPAPSRTVNP
ncbi:hypothetical protein [Streptomyces sp. 1331.2]|uniref:hypothetical protein n=1 Tax=Streptomyces sp. 1331.2 TaxID=1938835 RepID=UPI000BDC3C18|nr:hypothetical protein [Streptomyces sp. 1331.2]SOB85019.1 hypothetical protein SAMN06272789_5283 [Streptomyces sp. 1331.2]